MSSKDIDQLIFEMDMRDEDEHMVPDIVYSWVELALPDQNVKDIPLDVLLKIYPNIVRLGPRGDELMTFVDNFALVMRQQPDNTARLLSNYMKRFYTQHGKAFFIELNKIEHAGSPLSLRAHRIVGEERGAIRTYSLTALQLGNRLGTLARNASAAYASSAKNASMNDDPSVKLKLGIESAAWILSVEAGILPGLASTAEPLYAQVNKFVSRVNDAAAAVTN